MDSVAHRKYGGRRAGRVVAVKESPHVRDSPMKHSLHFELVTAVVVKDRRRVPRNVALDPLDLALLHVAPPRVGVSRRLHARGCHHPRRLAWPVQLRHNVDGVLTADGRRPIVGVGTDALVSVDAVIL